MRKGQIVVIIIVAMVLIFAAVIIFAGLDQVERLQSTLRKSDESLTKANNQLIEANVSQKELEEYNQKLLSYIEEKESKDNREPIGFKNERTKATND